MTLRSQHHPSRRFGQNFLNDQSTANAIVDSARLKTTDVVLEPGAGHGVLTRLLESKARHVIAVEKDRRLVIELRNRFAKSPAVEVIEGDVLKTRLPAFNKVVGTPPYNISSKLILFIQQSNYSKAHLVFQKEFAERLLAKPGTPDYGRLSVTAQRTMTIEFLMEVPRESFTPKPKVDSLLVSLEPKPFRTDVNGEVLIELVRGIFSQRRRLVRGALLHFLKLRLGRPQANEIVSSLTLPSSRVYELTVSDFEEIAVKLTPFLKQIADNSNNILRRKNPRQPGH